MGRALSVSDLLAKKYKVFDFSGEWFNAFRKPEQKGVWFIWGNSGNGKNRFVTQLSKELANYGRVVVNELEEGSSMTVQDAVRESGLVEVKRKVLYINEPMHELSQRLCKQKAPDFVIINSFQYTQLTYKQYISFKEKHKDKLIIFTSHADGKRPSGRSAVSVMYDASLKIWVEGYKAFSKGRYIGPTGEYTIWPEGASNYWGEYQE
ncbi:MAG: hypothetical protein HC896_00240 [Bacteroidales bacterium]|nr:hypothetical protein [Bacteroidales bacterium]